VRKKEERRRKIERRNHRAKYNGLPYSTGRRQIATNVVNLTKLVTQVSAVHIDTTVAT